MVGDFNTGFRKDKTLASSSSAGAVFNRHSSISFQSSEPSSSSSSYGMYPIQNCFSPGARSSPTMFNSNSPVGSSPAMFNGNNPVAPPGIGSGGGLPLSSIPGLNPDVELAVEWSPDEQLRLEENLSRFADEPNILKYIKIAAALPEKTVRDVALRCRWMTRKENGKRRKQEELFAGKKIKDRKEKPESSSKAMAPPAPSLNVGAYSFLMSHMSHNDLMPCQAPSNTTRQLLDENFQVFSNITANLATFKIQENVELLCRTRNNITTIINDMRTMPGIMSQMPPLPVSVNGELADIILPNETQAMMFGSPSGIYQNPDGRC